MKGVTMLVVFKKVLKNAALLVCPALLWVIYRRVKTAGSSEIPFFGISGQRSGCRCSSG
jgi:hypothetical protein